MLSNLVLCLIIIRFFIIRYRKYTEEDDVNRGTIPPGRLRKMLKAGTSSSKIKNYVTYEYEIN